MLRSAVRLSIPSAATRYFSSGSGRLAGKVAVITGATSGIGEATAELFVREGASVVLAGRSEDKGNALASKLGSKAIFQRCDVSKEEEIKTLIGLAASKFSRIDCLFNNAGAMPGMGEIETIEQKELIYGFNLLYASVVFGTKYVAPIMKKQKGGSIINNASIAAHRYAQGPLVYSSMKAAVIQYSKLAAVDLGYHNVRMNCVSPGSIATPVFMAGKKMSAEQMAEKMQKLTKNLAKATPLPRAGLPIDIAEAVLFLASDAGSFINGTDLVVDGGRIATFYERPPPAKQ